MASVITTLCGNASFWNTDELIHSSWPRLTECFQWTVLAWCPCLWLWLTFPIHLWHLRYRMSQDLYWVPSNKLNITKIFLCLLLTVLSILQAFIMSQRVGIYHHPYAAVTLALTAQAVTYILAAIITRISRKAGIASPCILFIYWFINVITHVPPIYSFVFLKIYNKEKTEFDLLCICYVLIVLEFFLHFIAEKRILNHPSNNTMGESPETFAAFPSKLTFHWMNSYIWKAYRRSIGSDEIWDLPDHYKSSTVVARFQKVWDAEMEAVRKKNQKPSLQRNIGLYNNSKDSDEGTPLISSFTAKKKDSHLTYKRHQPKVSLLKCLCGTFVCELLKGHTCRLMADFIIFMLPVLTSALIRYVQNKENETKWHGYALVFSFFSVTFIYSILFNQNSYIGDYVGMKVKTAVMAAIYKKSLTMSSSTRKRFTVGKIVNLMAIDCQALQTVTSNLYIVVSAPFQILVSFYFLNNILGVSFLAGVGVIIALVPLNARISVLARRAQAEQFRVKDERLKTMNEVLSGIKVLKLYAWETSFQDRILALRAREVKLLRTAAVLNIINIFSWLCSPVLVTVITFITYIFVSEEKYLDSNTAFVSLILFNILSLPMNKLPNIITDLVSAHVSLKRLNQFLSGEDLDPEVVTREPTIHDAKSFVDKMQCLRLHSQQKSAVSISQASFLWDKGMTPVLKNITANIPHGKLVAVVGSLGSGKSSLLSAMLGEMERESGEIVIRGSMAYVPQQAWIQNLTVKQNILFEKKYQHSRYQNVIKACALQKDLELLIGGENAEIGEKGTNLSGGQKQRISLARAVYYDGDIYLMDDPLSALDTHVGKHIFKHVISNSGMLRSKTRILVTNGIHWLPMVDLILVMDQGSIIQIGSYEELLRRDGPFAQFLKNNLLDEGEEVDDPEIRYIRSEMSKKVESVTSDGVTSADEDDRPRRRRLKRRSRTSMYQAKSEEDYNSDNEAIRHGFKIIEEEKSVRGKVKSQVMVDFIRAFGACFAISLVGLLMIYQGIGVGASIWLSRWTEDSYLKNTSLSQTALYQEKTYVYLGVYSALGFVQSVCALVFVGNISLRMVVASKRLHDALLQNIMRQPMKFFETTPLGRVINRFSRDVDTIDSQMARLVRMFFQQVFTVMGVLVVIIYTTPIFILAVLPIMVIYYFIQKFYVPTSRQLRRHESTTRSPIFSHFGETISGADSIRAFRAVDRFILESERRIDRNNTFVYGFASASRWIRIRLELVGNIIVMLDALFAIVFNNLSPSLVGLSVSYALQMTSTLNELVQNFTQLESNVVSVERIVEYSRLPQEPAWRKCSDEIDEDWPRKGDIEFHTYSMRYRSDQDLVLKNLSCRIKDGEKIGIVGRTGAGKSSMPMALFRMMESAAGSISIDGINIADIGLHDLRSKMTIIPQDPVLFSGSLRFNIDPFDAYTDDQIWQRLEEAQLKTFVSDLPGNLSYMCEEGGQNLSVGQRQLICLARSLMRCTRVLILDEATAAVDLETDELIQQTIRQCFYQCTILTVAHRLNTIMDYDRIMVLDAGSIVEFDTVTSLLSRKNSFFYGMAKEANLLSYLENKEKAASASVMDGAVGGVKSDEAATTIDGAVGGAVNEDGTLSVDHGLVDVDGGAGNGTRSLKVEMMQGAVRGETTGLDGHMSIVLETRNCEADRMVDDLMDVGVSRQTDETSHVAGDGEEGESPV